jgi:hypothetical protein
MALVKDTNSYVDLSEANAYFDDRLDSNNWEKASPTSKEQALITATNLLNNVSWEGEAVSDDQPLAFPRDGTYFEPRLGKMVDFPAGYPDRILTGSMELAYYLLSNESVQDETITPDVLKVGPITLEGLKPLEGMPSNVYNILKPIKGRNASSDSAMWWRAN